MADRVAELKKRFVGPYGGDRQVMPTMELIATTVHATPGADGKFRSRTNPKIISAYLNLAQQEQAYLLLNIQPGRAKFLDEVKAFERWLREPNVGVALDPEWAVGPGQIPGKVYGRTSGAELDAVAAWLASLVKRHSLPEKTMIYHQLHTDIVINESALRTHPGVALIKSVDGIGAPAAKINTWRKIVARTPKNVSLGFKLFYQEDVTTGGRLMTPEEVMALTPKPVYVIYE